MVLTFFLLRSSWNIQKLIFKLLLWKHLLILQTLLKAYAESMVRLTDFAVRMLPGFRKLLVSCESGFQKPFCKVTGRFSVSWTWPWIYVVVSSSAACQKVFHIHNWLLKPGKSSVYWVSVRICIISKCFHLSSFKMYV